MYNVTAFCQLGIISCVTFSRRGLKVEFYFSAFDFTQDDFFGFGV